MNKIEELKKEIQEQHYTYNPEEYVAGFKLRELLPLIDEAVSIATKEAVERERARYIEKIIDSPLTSDFIEYINNKYFPPQQEYCEWKQSENDSEYYCTTCSGIYVALHKSKIQKPCPVCGKPIKTISTPQQEHCEWEDRGNGYYLHCCGQDQFSDLQVRVNFEHCPFCKKPIKVKEV